MVYEDVDGSQFAITALPVANGGPLVHNQTEHCDNTKGLSSQNCTLNTNSRYIRRH
jgi:hypothetical protein